MVAKEILIIAKHEQEITGPEYHIEFHEGNNTGMMSHWTSCYLFLTWTEEHALPPIDKVASILRGEYIEHHYHHPHSKGGRKDEILRACHHFSILHLWLSAPSRGVILEEKLYPSSPKEQSAKESAKRLLCVSLYENASDYDEKTCQSHKESRVMHCLRCHGLVHYHHHGMAQRHGKQYYEKRYDWFNPIIFHW